MTGAFGSFLAALNAQFPAFVEAHTRADERAPDARAAGLADYMLITDMSIASRFDLFVLRPMFEDVAMPTVICQAIFDTATQEPEAHQRFATRAARDPFWQTVGQIWFAAFATEAVRALSECYLRTTLPTEGSQPSEGWIQLYQQTHTAAVDLWQCYSIVFVERLLATGLLVM